MAGDERTRRKKQILLLGVDSPRSDLNEDDDGDGIELATRKGRHINNSQCTESLSLFHQKEIEQFEKTHSPQKKRSEASAAYNCHGLAFAGRRAEIYDTSLIKRILYEDVYTEVSAPHNVLPGDILVYYSETGDAIHSAIVVSEFPSGLGTPLVVSKWGKGPEYIHRASSCPYDYTRAKYYRVTK